MFPDSIVVIVNKVKYAQMVHPPLQMCVYHISPVEEADVGYKIREAATD